MTIVCFVLFRVPLISCVPHRGEQVKQRTVHAGTLSHCYVNLSIPLFLLNFLSYIKQVWLCSDCSLHVSGLFRNTAKRL
jgi:hypothetical protein